MSNNNHPRSLVEFIIDAIDSALPGRGEEIYWAAFNRFNDYASKKQHTSRQGADTTQQETPLDTDYEEIEV